MAHEAPSNQPQNTQPLPEGVIDTFRFNCKWCGNSVLVLRGREKPHYCSYELHGVMPDE